MKLQPVQIDTEFCVLGDGWSGLCAAAAAARHGVKTVLLLPAACDVSAFPQPAGQMTGLLEEWRLARRFTGNASAPNPATEPNLTLLGGLTDLHPGTDGRRILWVAGQGTDGQPPICVRAPLFADCREYGTTRDTARGFFPDAVQDDMPYRNLSAPDAENLLLPFPSPTEEALSTRAAIGQAAGTAAALCRKYDLYPAELFDTHEEELRQTLLYDDCFLPGGVRDQSDAPLLAELSCDDAVSGDILNLRSGIDWNHPLFGEGDQGFTMHKGATVEYHMDEPTEISRIRIIFDADSPDASSLSKVFYLEIEDDNGWEGILFENENVRRLLTAAVCRPVTGIRLTVMETWGADDVHLFSFDFETT